MTNGEGQGSERTVTGETVYQAEFDPKIVSYLRWLNSLYLLITVVGLLLLPFWLLFSGWYGREYLKRMSARLTTNAVEIQKGVFFRKEATIPLNRITDVRLHDGPLMRHFGLRGLNVETAGQSGGIEASSEGALLGVLNAVEVRNAILVQRQKVLGETPRSDAPAQDKTSEQLLTEMRDILSRIEGKMNSKGS